MDSINIGDSLWAIHLYDILEHTITKINKNQDIVATIDTIEKTSKTKYIKSPIEFFYEDRYEALLQLLKRI